MGLISGSYYDIWVNFRDLTYSVTVFLVFSRDFVLNASYTICGNDPTGYGFCEYIYCTARLSIVGGLKSFYSLSRIFCFSFDVNPCVVNEFRIFVVCNEAFLGAILLAFYKPTPSNVLTSNSLKKVLQNDAESMNALCYEKDCVLFSELGCYMTGCIK